MKQNLANCRKMAEITNLGYGGCCVDETVWYLKIYLSTLGQHHLGVRKYLSYYKYIQQNWP